MHGVSEGKRQQQQESAHIYEHIHLHNLNFKVSIAQSCSDYKINKVKKRNKQDSHHFFTSFAILKCNFLQALNALS